MQYGLPLVFLLRSGIRLMFMSLYKLCAFLQVCVVWSGNADLLCRYDYRKLLFIDTRVR